MGVVTEQAVKLITTEAGGDGDLIGGVGARGAAFDDELPVDCGDLAA